MPLSSTTRAADDFATWHSLAIKALDTKVVDLVSSAQVRFYDNSRHLLQYKLTQSVAIDAHRFLRLGVGYTYLPTRLQETDDFVSQHRIELEVIPRWPVNDRWTLDFRNRLELRWLEGENGLDERSRHRLQAVYALSGLGPLKSLYASDELFLDYDELRISQNRLIPLGLNFRACEHAEFSLYYMLQSLNSANRWAHAQVLGTHLAVRL